MPEMVMSKGQGSEPCKGIPACSSQHSWLPVLPAAQSGAGDPSDPGAAIIPWGCDSH